MTSTEYEANRKVWASIVGELREDGGLESGWTTASPGKYAQNQEELEIPMMQWYSTDSSKSFRQKIDESWKRLRWLQEELLTRYSIQSRIIDRGPITAFPALWPTLQDWQRLVNAKTAKSTATPLNPMPAPPQTGGSLSHAPELAQRIRTVSRKAAERQRKLIAGGSLKNDRIEESHIIHTEMIDEYDTIADEVEKL